ncbi:prepilin-type N-terminal cleavage/methylation domain-containing protein [Candidatus Saccharibacteria bacterium]|nr:prepilin-type N-terminal cleavage/methylation domain-containing protein [Candidatus Saccharibacteria bacterium]
MHKFIEKLSKKTIKTKSGFTLVEFSIALTVLSILLIIILQVSNNTIAIYQKGLSTKAVSNAGRELLDELSRSIASSPTTSLEGFCDQINDTNKRANCKNGDTSALVYYKDVVKQNNKEYPRYGMFCTGEYSYFWNSGYALRNTNKMFEPQKIKVNVDKTPKLLRFKDSSHKLCIDRLNGANSFSVEQDQDPVDLLQNDQDLQVALYDFTLFPVNQNKTIARIFYSGTFVLGTLTGDIGDITASNDYCKAGPATLGDDFSYCAINKFNFAAQALGEQND